MDPGFQSIAEFRSPWTEFRTPKPKILDFPESRNPERSGEGPGSSLQKLEPALLKM